MSVLPVILSSFAKRLINLALLPDEANFMVPSRVLVRTALPHNQNGKIDRRMLIDEYQDIFQVTST